MYGAHEQQQQPTNEERAANDFKSEPKTHGDRVVYIDAVHMIFRNYVCHMRAWGSCKGVLLLLVGAIWILSNILEKIKNEQKMNEWLDWLWHWLWYGHRQCAVCGVNDVRMVNGLIHVIQLKTQTKKE